MAEQPSLFDLGKLNPHQFEPVGVAREGASAYTHGHYDASGLENVAADRFRGYGIQNAYRAAQTQPENPGIRRSYQAMKGHVNRQYDFMTKPKEEGGLGIQHEVVNEDPYSATDASGAQKMAADVGAGRIRTLSTAATGSHNFFSDQEIDKFRAVHDFFGHAATGRGFDAHGEEAAYLSHRQMFPKKAWPALTSETRGQNSYLNYGPGGLRGPDASFPEQGNKLIGLPAAAARVKRARP